MPPVPADDSTRLAPVARSERLVTLDVLRGLALLGVIIANMTWFSGVTFRFPAYRAEILTVSLDSIVYHAINVGVSGKAIATLSFLFGLGFSIQLLRARARQTSALPIYLRRLVVLLLFGLVHTVFLWYGDILTLYALLGFVLMAFHRRSDRVVLVSAGLLIVALPIAVGAGVVITSLMTLPDSLAILVGRRAAFARPDLALVMYALTIGTIIQAAGYVATVTLLMERRWWPCRLAMFAPAGRMALTNYLTQTIVCLAIFYGFGGGLVGRTGPALGLAIALSLYAAQMGFSALWLLRFRMGPVEWVWRSATYGRPQPMVLDTPPSLAPVAHA